MLSTVSDKGQVTLPKALRDELDIRPGTRLAFDVLPDRALRVRVLKRGSAGLDGLLQRPDEATRTLEAIDHGIAAAVSERSRRKR